MTSSEIRSKFLEFFQKKGHTIVKSSSLIPEGDSSVLFTTAGMQQFKPYYTGKKDSLADFNSKNTASVQKCIRTSDIDEVGDERHLTFFEMLGNFSFGGYGKEEAIRYAHEFITREMGLEISYVTVFKGLEGTPVAKDTVSKDVWQSLGVKTIKEEGMEDVFWGPTGNEGPCGPTTEIYCKNSAGQDIEVWNIVFNEFYCHGSREELLKNPTGTKLADLPFKGIDTGMGLERLVMISQNVPTIFETDLLKPVMDLMAKADNPVRNKRIIADHLRASVFLIADGVTPSNTDKGYILRRLIRRAIVNTTDKKLDEKRISYFLDTIVNVYGNSYPELVSQKETIKRVLIEETSKFNQALTQGMKEFERIVTVSVGGFKTKDLSSEAVFNLYTTHGLPFEIIKELAKSKGLEVDEMAFQRNIEKHQEVSKIGSEQKFKGGLADANDPMVVRYHTATHLLHQALHDVLGESEGNQKGSNITAERLRFDFTGVKLTDEQKKRVEDIVNEKIQAKLPMNQVTLPKAEAEKTGARQFFGEKYGDQISVYFIGNDLNSAYSKEFCGGPHVKNTFELAGPEGKWKFKIQKEEAVAQGIRRIKAVLE